MPPSSRRDRSYKLNVPASRSSISRALSENIASSQENTVPTLEPTPDSTSKPDPNPDDPYPNPSLHLRRPCNAPCPCPLRTTPSSPLLEFERILNRHREVCVPTFEGDIEKRPITNAIGTGLVTKKPIPAGSVVFADKVLCMSSDDFDMVRDARDVEVVLDRLAREMGGEWYTRFLELGGGYKPGSAGASDTKEIGERGGGPVEHIWQKHHLRAKVDDKLAGFLGLNLAWLNHSCLPNCALTLVKKYPYPGSAKAVVANDGGFLMPEEPIVTCAVVKAIRDIAIDEEITISYFRLQGVNLQRRLMSAVHGSFSCACHWCTNPAPVVEETYELQHDVDIMMSCPRIIERRPALILQVVHDLVARLTIIQNHDAHIALVWAHCGVIAGFHSDSARATVFLDKAIAVIRALRPAQDPVRRKYTRWRHRLGDMPGFGSTSWGMSTESQGTILSENPDILFMIVAQPNEYLRVGQYHPLTDTMKARIGPRADDATFMVSPDEEFDETREDHDWEAFPDRYLRSRDAAMSVKRKAAVHEVMKQLTKDLKGREDPLDARGAPGEKPAPACEEYPDLDEQMKGLCLNLAKEHPYLLKELKGTIAPVGAQAMTNDSENVENEMSDTDSSATIRPPAPEKKKQKKKKKNKKKGKGKGEEEQAIS